MAVAKKDQNYKSTILGVSSIDGETLVPIAVDSSTGYLLMDIVDTDTSLTPVLRSDARFDANHKPTMLGWNGTATQALITHNGYLAVQLN